MDMHEMSDEGVKGVIIFDFDGPIVDSFDACLRINQVVDSVLSADEYRERFMGNIFDAKVRPVTYPEGWNFFHEYRERFGEITLVPGMSDLLWSLSKNYTLHICSSTLGSVIDEWLALHHLSSCFSRVLGGEIKSKVEKITMLMKDSSQTFFVTDTIGDVHEALNAGIPDGNIVAVGWGYMDIASFDEFKIQKVHSIAELENIFSVPNIL